jgi:hypothetical protein
VKTKSRHDQIVSLLDEHSFLSVRELSDLCGVSEMTIRRDLEKLAAGQRLQRTYGGAVSVQGERFSDNGSAVPAKEKPQEALLLDEVDVLVATSVNPYYDGLLIDRATKRNIPIIAESIEMPDQRTIVAVDNYQAGFDLGCSAGEYFAQRGIQKINLLDLTFHQPNTQARSHGFADGLKTIYPSYKTVFIHQFPIPVCHCLPARA